MKELKPKLFSSLKKYSKQQLVKDITAGVIVAIIALPLSIALALASGVGPEQGLYTAIVAGFVISFLGGSRVQIAGPTAAFASIVAGIVAKNGLVALHKSLHQGISTIVQRITNIDIMTMDNINFFCIEIYTRITSKFSYSTRPLTQFSQPVSLHLK